MADILSTIINKVSVKGRCYLLLDVGDSKDVEELKLCYMIACKGYSKKWIIILATTSGDMWEYPKEVRTLFSDLHEMLGIEEINPFMRSEAIQFLNELKVKASFHNMIIDKAGTTPRDTEVCRMQFSRKD